MCSRDYVHIANMLTSGCLVQYCKACSARLVVLRISDRKPRSWTPGGQQACQAGVFIRRRGLLAFSKGECSRNEHPQRRELAQTPPFACISQHSKQAQASKFAVSANSARILHTGWLTKVPGGSMAGYVSQHLCFHIYQPQLASVVVSSHLTHDLKMVCMHLRVVKLLYTPSIISEHLHVFQSCICSTSTKCCA